MVLDTVSATNAASQQLRLDYITTKPLSSFSAFKDALPEQQRDLAFGLCSLRKGVFVQFTADVLVVDISLCQAFALKLASLMLDGVAHLCSIHDRSLAALLLGG